MCIYKKLYHRLEERVELIETKIVTLNDNDALLDRVKGLETQINEDSRSVRSTWGLYNNYHPTLKGKVNAIIDHLGLELKVSDAVKPKVIVKKGKK